LSPQQLFGWRRQLREAAASEAEELQFVPAVVDAVARTPVVRRRRQALRCESDVGTIEVYVEGVTIRVGRGANVQMIAAIVQALKASR
jgi:transposase